MLVDPRVRGAEGCIDGVVFLRWWKKGSRERARRESAGWMTKGNNREKRFRRYKKKMLRTILLFVFFYDHTDFSISLPQPYAA